MRAPSRISRLLAAFSLLYGTVFLYYQMHLIGDKEMKWNDKLCSTENGEAGDTK